MIVRLVFGCILVTMTFWMACIADDPDLTGWTCQETSDCGTLRQFVCESMTCQVKCKFSQDCLPTEECTSGFCKPSCKIVKCTPDIVNTSSCEAISQKGCGSNSVCVQRPEGASCQPKRYRKKAGQTCKGDGDCEVHLYCRAVKGYASIKRCTNLCRTSQSQADCQTPQQACLPLAGLNGFGVCEPQPTYVKRGDICGGDLLCGPGSTCSSNGGNISKCQ